MKGIYAALLAVPLIFGCWQKSSEYQEYTESGRPISAVANGKWLSVLYDPESKWEGPIVRSFDYKDPKKASAACAVVQGEIAFGDSAEISIISYTDGNEWNLKEITEKHFPFGLGEKNPTPEKDW